MNIEIWLADFTFYYKQSAKEKFANLPPSTFIVKDIITKRIPVRFVLNEGLSYGRATKGLLIKFLSELENDPATGLKKFTITYTKKIGEVDGNKD